MGWAIFLVVLGGIVVWFFWEMAKQATAEPDTDTRSGPPRDSDWSGDRRRDVRESGADYWLEWRASDDGNSRGYVVVRSEDGQRLSWQTLPKSEGVRAIGVAGESYRMEDLQAPAFDVGTELALVPEPENPHSDTAVAIKSTDEARQAGYVPEEKSSVVFNKLKSGEPLRCHSMWEVRKGGERVSLRVLVTEADASVSLPEA